MDRLLSNGGIELRRLLESWVRFVVGVRKEIVVALDWTELGAGADLQPETTAISRT